MITFNFRSSVAMTILGFVMGCCLTFLLTGSCNDNSGRSQTAKVKELEKAAQTTEAHYLKKITELLVKNRQLSTDLEKTKTRLDVVKHNSGNRAAGIKKMIGPRGYPAIELLKKNSPPDTTINTELTPCDSLVQEIDGYLRETEQKDSLYEAQISIQESIIRFKNSAITIQEDQHTDLMRLFNQSIQDQQKLEVLNKSLQKQYKRQKRRGKLMVIGIGVLSGIAANYLIHH